MRAGQVPSVHSWDSINIFFLFFFLSFFCCGSVLLCCSCFNYIFIFPNIFFIFLILFYFFFFVIVLLHFFSFSFAEPRGFQDLGFHTEGQAWAPVVGAPSPNHWTNREPQTPGNINQSEASQRSSSRHPALSNCLQTPVLDASGQTTSKTAIQPHPSKKNEMTKNYVTDEGTR